MSGRTSGREVRHAQRWHRAGRVEHHELQQALDLPPRALAPSEPLDSSRIDEWRRLLDDADERRVRATAVGMDHLYQA